MNITELLRGLKKEAVKAWAEEVFATYPLQTAGFLRTRNDPFANPVANMTREAANILFDAMIGEDVEPETVKKALERFIKFRAIQEDAPAKRLGVLYLFKSIMRKLCLPKLADKNMLAAYLECESRLDTLVLLAFEMYANAREILAESRIREIKTQYAQLARWAQKLEGEEGAPDRDGSLSS